jgi:hypothetical protein
MSDHSPLSRRALSLGLGAAAAASLVPNAAGEDT